MGRGYNKKCVLYPRIWVDEINVDVRRERIYNQCTFIHSFIKDAHWLDFLWHW